MTKLTNLTMGVVMLTAMTAAGCAGGPMTTREKGAESALSAGPRAEL